MDPRPAQRFRHPIRLAVVAAALLMAVGCGPRPEVVVVDGSSTVFPISVAAQVAYTRSVPGTPRITVDYHGTGGGFGRYIEGEVDIVNASRLAKPIEEEQATAKGYHWTRFLVGHDGITVAVNPANTFVDALSVDQLRELFRPESPIETWRDLNPDWPNEPISFYTPDSDSGTFDTFVHDALKLSEQREDIQPSADDNVLVNGIAGDVNAIGYFGFSYFAANERKLRAVPIRKDDEAEAIIPSIQTIYDGSYVPLSRPLFIYVKNTILSRPEAADFVTFYLDQAATLAEQAGYIAPNDQERAENLRTLSQIKARSTSADTTTDPQDNSRTPGAEPAPGPDPG